MLPMSDVAGGLIATSIYPGGRLDHQLACFERWRSLGLTVLSFNARRERETLIQAGVPAECLVQLDDDETLLPAGGGANPRILPVLQRMLSSGADSALLVNADIFAKVVRNPLPLMTSVATAAAYVRADCARVDEPADAARQSYFGGLDTFCFRRSGLDDVFARLAAHDCSAKMAFGVPGWDLFVGHEVLKAGGSLLEARFLLHPRHASGYSDIDAFAPLAASMLNSGRYKAQDHVALAAEFVERIRSQCLRHDLDARVMHRALAETGPSNSENLRVASADLAREVLLPGRGAMAAQQQRPDWPTLRESYGHLVDHATPLAAYMVALRAALALMQASGRSSWVTNYPNATAHAQQLRSCTTEPDPTTRRDRLLELMARDLFEHGTLNLNLLRYLGVQCAHEAEERLFSAFVDDLRRSRHDATAPTA